MKRLFGNRDIGEEERGVSVLVNLATKSQEVVPFEHAVQLGRDLRPQIVQHLRDQRRSDRRGPYNSTPMRSSRFVGVARHTE